MKKVHTDKCLGQPGERRTFDWQKLAEKASWSRKQAEKWKSEQVSRHNDGNKGGGLRE